MSTLRELPGGVTRRYRYGSGHLVSPGRGLSAPVKAASARSPCARVTTGTPLPVRLGPNMVERTRTAVDAAPARVSRTSVGHPTRRQGALARFVKPMYPPTVPAATPELTSLIFSCDVVHVRMEASRAPAAATPAPAQA